MNTNRSQVWRNRLIFCLSFLLVLISAILWKITYSGNPSARPAEPGTETLGTGVRPGGSDADHGIASAFAEELGIEISSLHLAVGGTRVALRYRVLDPARAMQLTNSLNRAYLRDARGQQLAQPGIESAGPLRRDSGQPPRTDRVYSYFFPNPDGLVKPGDTVTLVVGNLRAPDLVVR